MATEADRIFKAGDTAVSNDGKRRYKVTECYESMQWGEFLGLTPLWTLREGERTYLQWVPAYCVKKEDPSAKGKQSARSEDQYVDY